MRSDRKPCIGSGLFGGRGGETARIRKLKDKTDKTIGIRRRYLLEGLLLLALGTTLLLMALIYLGEGGLSASSLIPGLVIVLAISVAVIALRIQRAKK